MTVKVTYNGGIDQVDVLCPSGAAYHLKRGDTVDMLDSDAATLNAADFTGKGVGGAFDTPAPDTLAASPTLVDTPTPTEEN